MPDARTALDSLVAKALSGDYGETSSEANIFEQLIVPLLRDVLGWQTDDVREFDRQSYSRGAGTADAVLKSEAVPVVYIEAKRVGRIPGLGELRSRATFYSLEEEQAIRYARRSAGMRDGERWTVLTSFNRLRLFEASREERVLAFDTPAELIERFDELMLLSRDAVLGGALRRHFEHRRKPDVDLEFREVLLAWRLRLGQQLYNANRARFDGSDGLTMGDLQSAVQRLLDRLIVIQFAADIEALGGEDPLRELLDRTVPARTARSLVQPPSLSEGLIGAFRRFDELYNTALFAPGHVLDTLAFDEAQLRELVESIAGQSFRRFDVDILGTTYETYLGHVFRVVDGSLEMATGDAARRSGGVYYTPRSVVREIVDRTVRAQLASASDISEVDGIRVIDPACGSGSFLIEAFNAFADWYESENDRRRKLAEAASTLEDLPPPPVADFGRRILELNLYGVDLDPEALELAAVNLILQAMRRGLRGHSLQRLPMVLGQNLKVGNSLVPGYFRGRSLPQEATDDLMEAARSRAAMRAAADPESEALVLRRAALASESASRRGFAASAIGAESLADTKQFVWDAEFPEVFDRSLPVDQRGFAVVLGNPPWIGFQGDVVARKYLEGAYATAVGRFDIYVPFMELAGELTREGGLVGLITPSNYFLRDYGTSIRSRLKERSSVLEIVDYGSQQLFHGATNYPAITVWKQALPMPDHLLAYRRGSDLAGQPYAQRELDDEGWVFWTQPETELVNHVTALSSISSLGSICRSADGVSLLAEGVVTGQNDVFLLTRARSAELNLEPDLLRPCVKGADVTKWATAEPNRLLIYPYANGRVLTEEELAAYPRVEEWLRERRGVQSAHGGLAGRRWFDDSSKRWYELWNQRSEALLGFRKLITSEIEAEPGFAIVGADVAFTDSVTSATPAPDSGVCVDYLAGVLNSRLMALLHTRFSVPKANGYLVFRPSFLEKLPIRRLDLGSESQKLLHDRVLESVREAASAVEARRHLSTDFRTWTRDFTTTDRSLASELNRFGTAARTNLTMASGRLRALTTRRDGSDLIVGGIVAVAGIQSSGAAEELDLLRLRLPEPLASFLEDYLPTATSYVGPASGRRTLAARAAEVLIPNMNLNEMGAAVSRHQLELAKHGEATARLELAEASLDDAVASIYELKDDMRRAASSFVPPARRSLDRAT